MPQSKSPEKNIIIAGDAPVRLFLYPSDTKANLISHVQRPRAYWCRVGASLLVQFLQEGLKDHSPNVHIHEPQAGCPAENAAIHSILELSPYTTSSSRETNTFKMRRLQQIDAERPWHFPPTLPDSVKQDPENPPLVIFQETKTETRVPKESETDALALFHECRPCFLVYHMASRLCQGPIWDTVRHGPLIVGTTTQDRDPERLVLVVDADNLRAEGLELSRGLSWERTCEDFVAQIGSVGALASLATCAHLIVLFDCAGVIYHRGGKVAKPMLFFDPLAVEGEFIRKHAGYVPGVSDAFVAAFAANLVRSSSSEPDVEEAIHCGLQAARRLAVTGLAAPLPLDSTSSLEEKTSLASIYQATEVMRGGEKSKIISFAIPSDDIVRDSDPHWSLLDYTVGDPAEVARQIVKRGVLSPANQVPLAQFFQLILFDRREIEAFRAVYVFLEEYLRAPARRPLCIALFGPKGSGKAFAALKIAEAVSKNQKAKHLRFNLTQFTSGDDLLAAFHAIRDSYLGGAMPFVYFHGFDSSFAESDLGWLPYLLPAMFNGTFSDRGISRPIGPAVFFFGATSIKTYENLRGNAEKPTRNAGDRNRAQEFLTSLHGFVNILGPNKINYRDGVDRLYPVRRAVVLRSLLEKREPALVAGDEASIHDNVLNALLLVPAYRQGIRSLKSILDMSTLDGRCDFKRSSLPPPAQLDLHVDYNMFVKYLKGIPLPEQLREQLAKELHDVYQKAVDKIPVSTEQEKREYKSWDELSEEFKESSRAHADSMPSKLREIQCFLSEPREGRTPVEKFTDDQIELLAEMEHERWNAERLQNQWEKGEERDVKKRKSPFLVPWGDLDKKWQNVDRTLVASYPSILPSSHKIYKFGPRE